MDVLTSSRSATRELARQDLRRDIEDAGHRAIKSPFSIYAVDPKVSDVVGAWWRQETIVGDALSFLEERKERGGEMPVEDFNPYSYYFSNREQYADIERFIDDGYFDSIRGPRAFEARANSVREEVQRRELMEQGGTFGTIFGMAASLLDPSTFVPIVGWAGKASVVSKAVNVGLQTGGVVSVEELIHHQQQRARTVHESLMGVGAATLFGGTLGGLSALLTRKGKVLNDSHPDNPLAEANLKPDEPGSDTYDPASGLSMSEHIEQTTGAKVSFDPTEGVTYTRTAAERAVDWTQGKLGFTRSPATVAAHTSSQVVRNVIGRLAELNLHIKELADGTMSSRPISAEMLKDLTIYAPQQAAEETMTRAWYDLMKQFGHKSEFLNKLKSDVTEMVDFVRTRDRLGDPVNPDSMRGITLPEYQHWVWKRLMGDTEAHPHPAVEKGIRAAVDGPSGWRRFTELMHERLMQTGLLKEGQKIKNYFPQIWNTDAILANGVKLKELFKIKFAGRFKTDAETNEFVDALVDKLSNRFDDNVPYGFLAPSSKKIKVGDSHRLDPRELHLSPGELDAFRPYLVTDVTQVMKQYADDAGGRIVLREIFGAVDDEADHIKISTKAVDESTVSASFDDLSNVIKEVREEFATLRKEARARGESTEKIARDQAHSEQAIMMLMKRILNVDRIPDKENWGTAALYAARMARRLNFLRYMGAPVVSSIVDLTTAQLSHGIGPHLMELGRNLGRISTEAKTMNNREMAFLLYGSEGVLSMARTAKLMGIDDAAYRLGFGTGTTRKVSGGIEALANWGSDKMNLINLMHFWNSRHKFITGHVVLGNLLDDAAAMSKGAAGKYRWRELGVSDEMMKRIARLTKKHGYEEQRAGVSFRWPDVDKWSGEAGGLEAKIALHAALKRSTDRAVITPGIGDMPLFHSREIGQLLFQFNSFGFAAVNKYLRNLGHRAVNGEAVGMTMNVTMALSLGALAFGIKEGIVKGRFEDGTMPEEPATWVYEAIDRSGLMGWMMPYANAGLKLTSRPLADMGFPIEAPSRFAAQRWFQPILGPTFGGALGDIEAMTSHLVAGDLEKTWAKGRLFVPYRNVFYLEALMNAGED